jgi:poly(3-hydroxybutyrate) depolymerase
MFSNHIVKKLFIAISLIFILLTITLNAVNAQVRYQEAIFDSVDIQTYTYSSKNGQKLDIDVYSPVFDSEEHRAVVIYVHGGAFTGGTRNSPDIVQFCKKLAGYGYVCASISYRLTRKDIPTGFGCDCPATDKLNTFQAAVQDLQDATFFLIERRESFSIDPQRIILAGSSAGAETVLNTAYQPPMCYGLDSGPVSYAGVISMAGAIPDTVKIYPESAIPSLLFHGTCDDLVPYATAPHRYCKKEQPGYLLLYGSWSIADKLAKLHVPYWLYTTCGGGHEMAGKPMTEYFDVITKFCYDFVIQKNGKSCHTIIPGNQKQCLHEQFEFCNP